jgi:nucleoside-diphosphate-sugar epimerase
LPSLKGMRVSNAKARRELGWQPRFATYHEGIQAMVSPAPEGGRS